jgi:hypothetical protein
MVEHSPRKSIADLLLDSARQDLAACELLVSSPGMGDAVVGFHAQQAIEKALKAVLSVGTIEPDGLDRNRAVDAARQVLAWAANQVNVHEQSNPI